MKDVPMQAFVEILMYYASSYLEKFLQALLFVNSHHSHGTVVIINLAIAFSDELCRT